MVKNEDTIVFPVGDVKIPPVIQVDTGRKP